MPEPYVRGVVEDNLPLAYHAAMRVAGRMQGSMDMDDIKQSAVLGMLEGDRRWTADGGTKWSTYVWLWARSYAQKCVRTTQTVVTRRYDISPHGEVDFDDTFKENNKTPDPTDAILTSIMVSQVRAEVDKLPYKQRRCIELLYGLDGGGTRAFHEVATEMGWASHHSAWFHVQNGLKTLKEALASE